MLTTRFCGVFSTYAHNIAPLLMLAHPDSDLQGREPPSTLPLTTMATGIEAAGLALAVFPLLLKGLSVYVDGVLKFRDLRDWNSVLGRLVRELKVESYVFENVCGQLLEGMVSPGDPKEPMKENPWDDHEIQRKLRERMGPEVAETFTELVKELLELLENLRKELGIDAVVYDQKTFHPNYMYSVLTWHSLRTSTDRPGSKSKLCFGRTTC